MITEALLMELDKESDTTRRLMERVPEDKLGWKPHAKSMSLGTLAAHIATAPGGLAKMMRSEETDVGEVTPPQPASRAELMEMFENSAAEAKRILGGWDDAALGKVWTVRKAGQVVLSIPRAAAVRFILMNHMIHHRGQLSLYLRLLDVPLPVMYGPTADENPWAK
jgi:uncharacterized damage-inducible protein DinB